jgi:hypothetical protein
MPVRFPASIARPMAQEGPAGDATAGEQDDPGRQGAPIDRPYHIN